MPDFFGILIWAVFAGGIAFVVFNQTLQKLQRAKVIRWCYIAGGFAVCYFCLFAALDIKPFTSKATIFLAFIALPALVCGVLLTLQNLLAKSKNKI